MSFPPDGRAGSSPGSSPGSARATAAARRALYRAELVPAFWLLTKTTDRRIFQQKSVPDILRQVLAGLDVSFEIQGTFEPRDYCVQYRETDFDFASRLMEEEGIFYFFTTRRAATRSWSRTARQATPTSRGPADLRPDGRIPGGSPTFDSAKTQELRSGKVTLWDHNFELPQDLEATAIMQEGASAGTVTHQLQVAATAQLELYDYPGGYAERFDDPAQVPADTQRTAAIRIQQEAAGALEINGVLLRREPDRRPSLLAQRPLRRRRPVCPDGGRAFGLAPGPG